MSSKDELIHIKTITLPGEVPCFIKLVLADEGTFGRTVADYRHSQ